MSTGSEKEMTQALETQAAGQDVLFRKYSRLSFVLPQVVLGFPYVLFDILNILTN